MYKKGVVVLVPFPFTDLSAHKVRPALIVSSRHGGNDVVVAFISSRAEPRLHALDIRISTTHSAFDRTGLKADSVIKVGKLATLDKKIILGELGKIDHAIKRLVNSKLKQLFAL